MATPRRSLAETAFAALVVLAAASHAATPAQDCRSAKNKEAGKYDNCRQKAEAKFAVTADSAARTTALQKCSGKFATKWPLLEAKAVAQGGACPSVADQSAIQGVIDDHTVNIA